MFFLSATEPGLDDLPVVDHGLSRVTVRSSAGASRWLGASGGLLLEALMELAQAPEATRCSGYLAETF
jgi:hypothetical protein